MTTLALFGTSADPPTAGHQQILRWLSYQYDHVIVWASDNPLKSGQTPLLHRAAMLSLLVNDIEPPRHNLHCRQEVSHPRTIETVAKVRQEWPDADLTFVIGSDLIGQLPRWYQSQAFIQQVKLLIVPRPGYPILTQDLEQLRQMGATVAIANLQGLPVSSTAYRELVYRGTAHVDVNPSNLSRTLGITPLVHDYILRESLYSSPPYRTEEQPTNVKTSVSSKTTA
ncbi:MAG: nicotinate-nucleotide adenylyltransferase [Merismopedia sp. SIO2A8]|nr:nicotinate-nucleotide adenylyltransferase [Merismopedia sp. SIO2A8]